MIGIETSPINGLEASSLGAFDGDGVGTVGTGEMEGAVGAFDSGESVASKLGALVSPPVSELGDFVVPPSTIVGADDDVSGEAVAVSVSADGSRVGKVVIGAGVGDSESSLLEGEDVSSTASLIVGLRVTGRSDGLRVGLVTGFFVGTKVGVCRYSRIREVK